jgi:hypothetical protein
VASVVVAVVALDTARNVRDELSDDESGDVAASTTAPGEQTNEQILQDMLLVAGDANTALQEMRDEALRHAQAALAAQTDCARSYFEVIAAHDARDVALAYRLDGDLGTICEDASSAMQKTVEALGGELPAP